MAIVDTIAVLVTAQTQPFEKGMGRAAKTANSFGFTIDSIGLRLRNFAVTFGATAAVFGAFRIADRVITDLSRFVDLADSFGVSVERIQEIEFLGGQTGVDVETLAKSFNKLEIAIDSAGTKGGESAESFERLGLNVKSLAGLTQGEKLNAVADAFAKLTTQSQRSAIAQDLFGKGGIELVRILRGGSSSLEGYNTRARLLGLVSEEGARGAEAMGDSVERLEFALKGLTRTLVAESAPAIDQFAKFIERTVIGTRLLAQAAKEAISGVPLPDETGRDVDRLITPLEKLLKKADEGTSAFRKLRDAIAKTAGEAGQFEIGGRLSRLDEGNKLLTKSITDSIELGKRLKENQKATEAFSGAQERLAFIEKRLADLRKINLPNILNLDRIPKLREGLEKEREFQKKAIEQAPAQLAILKAQREELLQRAAAAEGAAAQAVAGIEKNLLAAQRLAAAQKAAPEIIDKNRTAFEKFTAEIATAGLAQENAAITTETFTRELERQAKALGKELVSDKPLNAIEQLNTGLRSQLSLLKNLKDREKITSDEFLSGRQRVTAEFERQREELLKIKVELDKLVAPSAVRGTVEGTDIVNKALAASRELQRVRRLVGSANAGPDVVSRQIDSQREIGRITEALEDRIGRIQIAEVKRLEVQQEITKQVERQAEVLQQNKQLELPNIDRMLREGRVGQDRQRVIQRQEIDRRREEEDRRGREAQRRQRVIQRPETVPGDQARQRVIRRPRDLEIEKEITKEIGDQGRQRVISREEENDYWKQRREEERLRKRTFKEVEADRRAAEKKAFVEQERLNALDREEQLRRKIEALPIPKQRVPRREEIQQQKEINDGKQREVDLNGAIEEFRKRVAPVPFAELATQREIERITELLETAARRGPRQPDQTPIFSNEQELERLEQQNKILRRVLKFDRDEEIFKGIEQDVKRLFPEFPEPAPPGRKPVLPDDIHFDLAKNGTEPLIAMVEVMTEVLTTLREIRDTNREMAAEAPQTLDFATLP